MVLNSNQDQVPQQPTAASFRADSAYRGFKHWFVSYAFLPRYRTRPAGGGPLLDRQGLLPPSVPPRTSDCPSASPDRYGGRGWVLSSHPVNGASWRSAPRGQLGSRDRVVGRGWSRSQCGRPPAGPTDDRGRGSAVAGRRHGRVTRPSPKRGELRGCSRSESDRRRLARLRTAATTPLSRPRSYSATGAYRKRG
jgi:hypothetical protein